MKAIQSSNTSIELLFGRSLKKLGFRIHKENRRIFGKPDFTLRKYRIAIFCDSEFFHGKNWTKQRSRIGTNEAYWVKKIGNNIKRDRRVNKALRKEGWFVLRFWGNDIKKNINGCLGKVNRAIKLQELSLLNKIPPLFRLGSCP